MSTLSFCALDRQRDLDAVTDLALACDDYTRAVRGTPADAADGPAFFEDAPPERTAAGMVKLGAFENGALLGIADIVPDYPTDGIWYLGLMLVRPEERGRGIGPLFLDHIDGLARAANADRLSLSVMTTNKRALHFWKAQGFRAIRRLPRSTFGRLSHERLELARPLGFSPSKPRPIDRFVDASGRLTVYPAAREARGAVLDYLLDALEPGRFYSEAEVNTLLAARHTFEDWALLRRELFESGRLARRADGSAYWRAG